MTDGREERRGELREGGREGKKVAESQSQFLI